MSFSTLSKRTAKFFGSTLFFRLTIAWFVVNTGWIAMSAAYPMAFDEQHHYGLIQLYSQKLTPFWSAMPDGGSVFGALTRDPSYMFHYLMSFPMRLINLLVGTEMNRVLILRLLCLLMFGAGIVLFRKLLRRIGLSAASTNVSLFFFVSLPIVPLLAAQINYDNLLFLLTPLSILQLINIVERLRQHKEITIQSLLSLGIIVMFALLVKFSFLPVALMMFGVLIYYIYRYNLVAWRKMPRALWQQFQGLRPRVAYGLVTLFVVLFGLCIERYGVNLIRYNNPAPDCAKVLSMDDCMAFGPWRRNYNTRNSLLAGRLPTPDPSLRHYIRRTWYPTSVGHLFFALDGPRAGYIYGSPFIPLQKISITVTTVGLLLFVGSYPWRRKKYMFGIMCILTTGYVLSLLQRNFSEYQYLGYPFGIQGRYLVLFLPILIAAAIAGYATGLKKLSMVKPWLAVAVLLVVVTQGGGAATYILRSDSNWYWQRPVIIRANNTARRIIDPLVLGQ